MSGRRSFPRRLVLRGSAGLCLALPWLESALPRHARAQELAPPKRLLVWTQPNGTVMDRWVPLAGASETDFTLSEILKPLERHQADMVVLQNLMQYQANGHQYVTSLTGYDYVDLGTPKYLSKGVSLDQYVAQQLAGATPLASLELGVCQAEDGQGALSWSAAGKSVVAEASPFKVYARLMGGGSSTVTDGAQAALLLAHRRSLIDTVLDPLSKLEKRLGSEDRASIENYLESVRGVERELTALQARLGSCSVPEVGSDPSTPGQTPWWQDSQNAPALLSLQRKLAVAALACDLTRVVTLTVAGSSGGARTFDYIDGVSQRLDWHGFSHEVEKGSDTELTQIEKWHAEQLALLLDDLKAISEPGGSSLLESTLVLTNNEYGSNGPVAYLPADPASGQHVNLTHLPKLMPYLLFGQCGGALKTGRNLILPFQAGTELDSSQANGYSHTRLLVSVLNALGFEDTTFGNPEHAEGTVPGLLT
jgi:Protein of unknown function (DUF1552)